MKRLLALIVFICALDSLNPLLGQNAATLKGRVTYARSGEPAICYVTVLSLSSNAVIAYGSTDPEGNYSVAFSSVADSVALSLSGLTVKTLRQIIPNSDGTYDFKVEESQLMLDEVKIKAAKISQSEDTVSYNVESFRSKEDKVIEDVLKKLPGITVENSGRLLYKQKPIAGLTIDGMDLLKGRYGLATKNISPNHISTVEILENHQAVKALKNLVPSDKTYINLKLKTASKGVFVMTAALGGGYGDKWLWDAEAAPMYFGHWSQHILTGKTNNIGEDLRTELQDLTSETYSLNPVLASPTLASPPDISKEKYYFNTSYSASVNNLFRTRKGDDITVNASFLKDKEDRNSATTTEWMLPDSSINAIAESIGNRIRYNEVNAEADYRVNRNKIYVNFRNLFSGKFQDASSIVNGLGQDFNLDRYKGSSRVSVISRSNERNAYEMNANVEYEHAPYSLEISPDGDGQYAGAVQNVTSDGLRASFFFGSHIRMKLFGLTLDPSLSTSFKNNVLDSHLSFPGDSVLTASTTNDVRVSRLRLSPMIAASYSSPYFKFGMDLPLSWYLTSVNDKATPAENTRNRLFFEPRLNMHVLPSASTDLAFSYSLMYTMPEISALYEGVVLRNYRSLTRYRADLTEGISNNFGLGFNLKDIFNMFFMNIDANYRLTSPKILYGYDFNGIYSSTITSRTGELSRWLTLSAEFSKSFFWKNMSAKLNLNASFGNSPYLMQGITSRVRNQTYSGNLHLSLSPFTFLGINYDGDMMYSLSKQSSGDELAPLLTASNSLRLNLRLPAGIGLEASGEHYYNDSSDDRNFFLLDAAATYSLKKCKWELRCLNLFDTNEYVYSCQSYGNSFSSSYRIRPRSFILRMFISF